METVYSCDGYYIKFRRLLNTQGKLYDEQLWRVEIKISVGVPHSSIRVSLKKVLWPEVYWCLQHNNIDINIFQSSRQISFVASLKKITSNNLIFPFSENINRQLSNICHIGCCCVFFFNLDGLSVCANLGK